MNYSRKKWEEIGLLETTPEDRKDATAKVLNIALKYLLDKEEEEKNVQTPRPFETLGIPVLVRIMREVNLSDDEVITILDEMEPAMKAYDFSKFNGYPIDVEMEFCHEYSTNKLEQLKNTF